jgi:hypothetical protein
VFVIPSKEFVASMPYHSPYVAGEPQPPNLPHEDTVNIIEIGGSFEATIDNGEPLSVVELEN